jgi:hypothetical protein
VGAVEGAVKKAVSEVDVTELNKKLVGCADGGVANVVRFSVFDSTEVQLATARTRY